MTTAIAAHRPRAAGLHRLIRLVVVALLITAVLGLQIHHFAARNYRQDELNTIHAGLWLSPSGITQWLAAATHPPLWRIAAGQWVAAFGTDEGIVRFSSTLLTAVCLALVYRLGVALSSHRVGVIAVFLLGTLAFFTFFSHELRPYPALAAFTVAVQLSFLLWMQKPTFRHALWFVVSGIVVLYTHPFGLYVIAAQALVFVLVARWDRALYQRAAGLFAALALAYVPWMLPLVHSFVVAKPGGVPYADTINGEWFATIHQEMQIRPFEIGIVLLMATVFWLVGRLAPSFASGVRLARFRGGNAWRVWYVLLFPLVVFGIAFVVNLKVGSITNRNLILLLPSFALLVALAVSTIPRSFQLALAIPIAAVALGSFVSYIDSFPYREMLAFMSPTYQQGDVVLVMSPRGGPGTAASMLFNFIDRLPGGLPRENILSLSPVINPDNSEQLDSYVGDTSAQSVNMFWARVGDTERLWFFRSVATNRIALFYKNVLEEQFAPLRSMIWDYENSVGIVATEYRRAPDDLAPLYAFGDQFTLHQWTFHDDVQVQPCQTVRLESWWSAQQPLTVEYSMTLVLADASGVGVAQTDLAPAEGTTVTWQPGRYHVDERALVIPCDAAPGEYSLLLGMYDPLHPVPALAITTSQGAEVGSLLYLTTLHVQ